MGESDNCKKELTYAESRKIEILPCMAEDNFEASSWLGICIAGLLWQDFKNQRSVNSSINSLVAELQLRCPDIRKKKIEENIIEKDEKPKVSKSTTSCCIFSISHVKNQVGVLI